jgi:hypothetical protein
MIGLYALAGVGLVIWSAAMVTVGWMLNSWAVHRDTDDGDFIYIGGALYGPVEKAGDPLASSAVRR